mgnify:CR=1 FL=1
MPAFLTTYYDIWSDGNVSNVERRKFQFLGKGLKMSKKTIERLLDKKSAIRGGGLKYIKR